MSAVPGGRLIRTPSPRPRRPGRRKTRHRSSERARSRRAEGDGTGACAASGPGGARIGQDGAIVRRRAGAASYSGPDAGIECGSMSAPRSCRAGRNRSGAGRLIRPRMPDSAAVAPYMRSAYHGRPSCARDATRPSAGRGLVPFGASSAAVSVAAALVLSPWPASRAARWRLSLERRASVRPAATAWRGAGIRSGSRRRGRSTTRRATTRAVGRIAAGLFDFRVHQPVDLVRPPCGHRDLHHGAAVRS